MKISLIIPSYNEEESLPFLYKEICKVSEELSSYPFEMIFVNDGSSDGTLEILKRFAAQDKRVVYLSFSRNFGKEAAMYAGFCNADGDYVAVMDADMQDPPSLLPEMVRIIEEEGYDSVATRRVQRIGEPKIRSFFARMFYKIINKISDVDIVDGARDFRLMKREMVDSIVKMGEYNRFSKGIYGWIGYRTYWLPYENVERVAGKTKWSFWGLFKYSKEGNVNFSSVPLYMASMLGLIFCGIAFVAMIVIIIRKLLFGDPVAGWPSLVCIITFIGGIQLFCIGIIGAYLAKMYIETKGRPIYIVRESNLEDRERVHNEEDN